MAVTADTLRSPATPLRGRATTFAQYQGAVEAALRERRGLRTGQAFFNVLLELDRISHSA
jgi:hypothetical protein